MDHPIKTEGEKDDRNYNIFLLIIGLIVTISLIGTILWEPAEDQEICPYNVTSVWFDAKNGSLERVKEERGQELHAVWDGNYTDWLNIYPNSNVTLCRETESKTGYCNQSTVYNHIIIPCSPCVNVTKEGQVIVLNETECLIKK